MTFVNILLRRWVLQLSFVKLYLGEINDPSGKLFFVSVFTVLKKGCAHGSSMFLYLDNLFRQKNAI